MGAGGYLDLPLKERSIMAAAMSGAKLLAVQEVTRNIESIHAAYKSMDAETFWHYAVDNIRGLGLAKAAFTVQMLYNEMGCLDAHNLREIGVSLKEVSGKSIPRRKRYLEVQASRTSQVWWDGWCTFLAKRYPGMYRDGNEVSESHIHAVL